MMNHTVIVDDAERERRVENRLNVAVRHCKIGKVNSKQPAFIQSVFAPWIPDLPQHTWPPFHWPNMTADAAHLIPAHGVMI